MKNLNSFLAKFRQDESGAAMVEYVLIAGLISIVAIALIQSSGTSVTAIWTKVSAALAKAAA
jgi:pilus assembly protein Flp/PilA